jgi:hypothetical protein
MTQALYAHMNKKKFKLKKKKTSILKEAMWAVGESG